MREICLGEWVTFYTFGQTLDRIEYARMRQRQIAAGIRPDQAAPPPSVPTSAPAVPDPTSALVPPPMMLAVDGGPGDAAPDVVDAADDRPPPAACENTCAAKYKRCMRRCF